ncbi:MAG: HIT domain-containing protein [Chthonomonas sp.]|nr:HIT domain-containing protein [Chthonomonas sp.]
MASIFTRILNGEIPGEVLWQDEHCFAIRDIHPQAPTHVLVIPKTEVQGVAATGDQGDHNHLLNAARKVAEQLGLTTYRLVINQGPDAGQVVDHLHVHLLAGKKMTSDFA